MDHHRYLRKTSSQVLQILCISQLIYYNSHLLDNSKIEAEVNSDMNSEIQNILPNIEEIKKIVNDALDLQVGHTDMKVRHILTKSVEVKFKFEIPFSFIEIMSRLKLNNKYDSRQPTSTWRNMRLISPTFRL